MAAPAAAPASPRPAAAPSVPPRAFLAGATLATLAFLGLLAARPWGDVAAAAIDDLGTLCAGTLATALAFRASRQATGRTRTGWGLLAVGSALWSFGNLVWTYEELVLRLPEEELFPSLADVGFLAFAPFTLAALAAFTPRSVDRLFRLRTLVDAVWIGLALLLVSWVLVLGPLLREPLASPVEQALVLLYPLLDVVLASMALSLLVRAGDGLRAAYALLAVGVLLLAVADTGFAYFTVQGDYETGVLTDAGWLAGFLAIAGAALLGPRSPEPVRAEPARRLGPLLAPYAVVLAAILVVGRDSLATGRVDAPVVLLVATLVLLLVLRESLAHTEVNRLARSLDAARATAEGALAARDAVVRIVVHDLQNSITPLALHLKVLELAAPAAAPAASGAAAGAGATVPAMRRSLRQLALLVEDLRDMTALDSGRLAARAEAVDVLKVAREAAAEFGAAAAEKGLRLEVAAAPDPPVPPARADPDRLAQALRNLLSNAVKFTPSGGAVRVSVRRDGGHAAVEVADTGRGIAAADLGRLFQPFSRVGDQGRDTPKGTGLGLYISRGIAERMGGSLAAASPGEGQGSTFTLRLPLLAA